MTLARTLRIPFPLQHWFLDRLLIVMWAVFVGWLVFARFQPASHWLDVREIIVHDTPYGQTPVMSVDRVINDTFTADWLAEVEVKTDGQSRAGFAVFCSQSGTARYHPDAVLPNPLTLDWWTYPKECKLPVGEYRLDTTWLLHIPGYPDKQLEVISNNFKVY